MYTRGLVRQLLLLNLLFFLLICPALSFASAPAESSVDSSVLYGYLYIGDNSGDISSNKLKNVDYKGGGPLEWGIGMGRYLTNTISVEGTFEYWGERYERQGGTVIPETENNVIQIGGLGLSVSAIYNYTSNPFHSYVGLGAGYFLTGILVTQPGTGLLGDAGAPSDKLLPGYHAMIGLDYRINGNHKLGVEVKRRILKADFGQYTNGEVDIGGTYFLLMYRHSSR